jgi:hypothetical protein
MSDQIPVSFEGFREAKFSSLECGLPLPCDIYVESISENRLVKLHTRGDTISRERYRRFREKKVRAIWIREGDQKSFDEYLKRQKPSKQLAAHHLIVDLVEAFDEEEKSEVWLYYSSIAREIAFKNGPPDLGGPRAKAREIYDLWLQAEQEVSSGSALRVAVFAILFVSALQDFEPDILVDLAFACLASSADGASDRVLLWLDQRYERFDGSGTPNGLKGFEIDDISQMLAIADTVEEIFYGVQEKFPSPRSLEDACKAVESLNAKPPFPQLFNPDLFSLLVTNVFKKRRDDSSGSTNSLGKIAA